MANGGGQEGSALASTCATYLCAAFGGLLAASADLIQKEQASAVLRISAVTARHMEMYLWPPYALLIVVFFSALLCLVFQPVDRKSAFTLGLGIVAMLMTVTPYSPPPTGAPSSPRGENIDADPSAHSAPNLAVPFFLYRAQHLGREKDPVVNIQILNRNFYPQVITISVYDRESEQEYFQKNQVDSLRVADFVFELPRLTETRPVSYVVSANNVVIGNGIIEVHPDSDQLSVRIIAEQRADVEDARRGLFGVGERLRGIVRSLDGGYAW